MVKTATKRKDNETASIKKRLSAALCMLLVSLIMLISSTYAWFTLSTAPEVSNIATTVTGNGSLEIALMPGSGQFGEISINGRSASGYNGKVNLTAANLTWGNVVDLNDTSYGLSNIFLYPAQLNFNGDNFADSPLIIPTFGYDGRPEALTNTVLAKLIAGDAADDEETTQPDAFKPNSGYGVRAIAANLDEDGVVPGSLESYGYVVDLAFRINTLKADNSNAKLFLQTDAMQRIYNENTTYDEASTNIDTMGEGSVMTFDVSNTGLTDAGLKELLSAIRITFVQNYGNGANGADVSVLGTATLSVVDEDGKLNINEETHTLTSKIEKLYDYSVVTDEEGESSITATEKADLSLVELPKNQAVQVSAIVWLDGSKITNASVSAEMLQNINGTLNLQFTTDAILSPANNSTLNPPKIEANEEVETPEEPETPEITD